MACVHIVYILHLSRCYFVIHCNLASVCIALTNWIMQGISVTYELIVIVILCANMHIDSPIVYTFLVILFLFLSAFSVDFFVVNAFFLFCKGVWFCMWFTACLKWMWVLLKLVPWWCDYLSLSDLIWSSLHSCLLLMLLWCILLWCLFAYTLINLVVLMLLSVHCFC